MDQPRLTVCATCRFSLDEREDEHGIRGGALFLAALRAAGPVDVEVVETECLWACTQHCTVHLQALGKTSYLLGRFAPTPEAAAALLAYVAAYADSAEGTVPYRQWPEGVKGHFIARIPG
ncbi:MAG: hypothetical protein JWP92_2924 [Caulobacter sp.]|nr:hypothetical protein [Caulobacter sp.]